MSPTSFRLDDHDTAPPINRIITLATIIISLLYYNDISDIFSQLPSQLLLLASYPSQRTRVYHLFRYKGKPGVGLFFSTPKTLCNSHHVKRL